LTLLELVIEPLSHVLCARFVAATEHGVPAEAELLVARPPVTVASTEAATATSALFTFAPRRAWAEVDHAMACSEMINVRSERASER
jgi:hypothetical protein